MPEIRVEALRREYRGRAGARITALAGLSLTVAEGELLVVVGPSGSGKSTLLRLVAGLEEPDSGGVWIGGRPTDRLSPRERGVAMVMQDHPLFPHLDVRANLGLSSSLAGISQSETAARVARVARVLGLEPLLGRRPHELSGGERQWVGLGGALATGARVILLDEPLAQLDAVSRARLRLEIRRAQREFGATLIHVTHDQSEAMALADRLAVVRAGQLEQVGAPMRVYREPANAFVAQFLGLPGMNLLKGSLRAVDGSPCFELETGGMMRLQPGEAPSLAGEQTQPWGLGIRPESVRWSRSGGGRGEGVVEAVEPLGHEILVRLRLGAGAAEMVVRASVGAEVSVSDRVSFDFDAAAIHWFEGETGKRWGIGDGGREEPGGGSKVTPPG